MEKIITLRSENFEEWNTQKQFLNEKKPYKTSKDGKKIPKKSIKEWEIWWCRIGVNIGQEIYGKWPQFTRPVLILKKISGYSCIVIPTTSEPKEWTWFYPIKFNSEQSFLIFPQIRLVSTARFENKIEEIFPTEFSEIKKKAGEFYGLI